MTDTNQVNKEILTKVTQDLEIQKEVLSDMMGDAPACNECGHITIRNGSCYKCLNCGTSVEQKINGVIKYLPIGKDTLIDEDHDS